MANRDRAAAYDTNTRVPTGHPGPVLCRIFKMTQPDSFGEFDATSLFGPRCRRATPTRRKLLLVLPSGNKYDYVCAECGTAVGGKTDNDSWQFYRTVPPPPVPRRGRRS
jgi:hypothetical protein